MFQSKPYEHSFNRPTGFEQLQFAVNWLLGPEPISEKRPGHLWPRWIFLRALGLIYFSAFYSLLFQVKGLIGTSGLLPAADYLKAITSAVPGVLRFWYAPTLLWISPSNRMLMAICWIGLIASVILVFNIWPRGMLLVCFVCYLSFVAAAQDFSGYQSDGMLLEAGFISLFFAPPGFWPGLGRSNPPSRASLFLLQWEWFRIYFESGVAKIRSGDPTWRNFTAMDNYYQNGPLPTWIGWYVQHFPHWFHAGTVALTLGVELVLVWMLFLPRRFRIICFCIVTPFEIGIILTANYTFLNYIVLSLGFLLLDDRFVEWVLPQKVPEFFKTTTSVGTGSEAVAGMVEKRENWRSVWRERLRPLRMAIASALLGVVFYATTAQLIWMFLPTLPLPLAPISALEPFRIANRYGLFAVMTPERLEIEFQGSSDGKTWIPYPFRYKPQDLKKAPGIYAPYQPRFDWNLWFASLGGWRDNRFVLWTEERLLQNDADVLHLFAGNPFAGRPQPIAVRAIIYQYWFTDEKTKRETGDWWRRELLGAYAPALERQPDGRIGIVDLPIAADRRISFLWANFDNRRAIDVPAAACERLCAGIPIFVNEHALNAARIPLACAWRLSPIMKHPRKYKGPKDSEKESNPSHVTEEQVIGYLSSLSRPESIRQIAHGMELQHHGRRFLPRIIQYLKSRGDVEEIRAGQYQLAESKQSARAAAKRGKSAAAEGQKRADADSASAGGARRSADPNLVSGRIVAHRDGYGFLVPDKPIPRVEGDLFIGRDSMADAMHGDRVLARVERRKADGRAEGRVVQILERENPTVVGLFRYGPHGNVVLPYDTRIQHEVSIPPGDELTPELREKVGAAQVGSAVASHRRLRLPELDGAVVNVEITRYPKGGLAPAGRVIEILGRPGDIGVDVEIIIRKHHLPHIFPAEVIAEAQSTPQGVSDVDLRGRRDFRDLPIVTIDGETARDFDDAVHVTELPSGRYELQVHIADVAHYVARNSPLDREAHLRGTSVYFPNRAVPMLPEELSNGICSLNPKVDRLVMSAIMEIDASGNTVRADFTPGVIRSAERMTYTNVHKILEGDAEMNERYAPLVGNFRRMKELALLLNKKRVARGSIDFDLPEPIIEFDEQGRMLSIVRSVRNIAHRIIEEFMLAANKAVAQYLERRGVASLHRVHEKPDPKKVIEFEELAHAFGYSLGVEDLVERRIAVRHGHVQPATRGRGGRDASRGGRMRPMSVTAPAAEEVDIRPQHYQRLTEKIAGKPEERILSYLMLRSLKQARYAVEVLGHFALATKEYTHFTSPIRRYPDLIVHRALKWALANPNVKPMRATIADAKPGKEAETVAMLGPYRRIELEEIASESSEAERRAEAAERELMEWKTAQFMESHLGEEYEALIISVQKFGFFVELVEIFVEGLVSIDRLEEVTGMRCTFRERDHVIVAEPYRGGPRGGKTQRIFRLGDRVRVRAERIDPMRHRVEFSLI